MVKSGECLGGSIGCEGASVCAEDVKSERKNRVKWRKR